MMKALVTCRSIRAVVTSMRDGSVSNAVCNGGDYRHYAGQECGDDSIRCLEAPEDAYDPHDFDNPHLSETHM